MSPRTFRKTVCSWWTLALAIGVTTLSLIPGARGAEKSALPDATEDLHLFEVADGFEITLFAADPAIAKPIQMNFDSKGRLWVATSQTYPQLEPGLEPKDQIILLEDTNKDGVADKSSVFADGLLMPTGIEIGDEGVYVGHSTELLHFQDTDGDGRADKRRVVLSAFGTEDTHHLLHTFRWAPWGDLYFAQSVYIHSHVETPGGVKRLNGGGYWTFRPQTGNLDVFVHGMINSWGIAWDDFGQSFGVDNDWVSPYYFLPGARLRHVPGEAVFLDGLTKDKPKYSGAEFVASRSFPDDWQGDLITCDFRAHRVCRYRLGEEGAGYTAEELAPLVSSSSINFRPIDVKFGPDGALYICDWYNPIINHGEVDFRDPRRDKSHGRIWRVAAKKRPQAPRVEFETASTAELVSLQSSAEEYTRQQARRILTKRPAEEVVRALNEWRQQDLSDVERLRAMWVYESINKPQVDLLGQLLASGDGRVRAAATRLIPAWSSVVQDPLELLSEAVMDSHPRVRMEAVRALAAIGTPKAIAIALQAVDSPQDRFLTYALELTSRETAAAWLAQFDTDKPLDMPPTQAKRWVFALLSLRSVRAAGPLLKLWQQGLVAPEQSGAVLASITRFGTPSDLRVILNEILSDKSASVKGDAQRAGLLESLREAMRVRQVKPSGDLAASLEPLLKSPSETVRLQALSLVGWWKVEQRWQTLVDVASDAQKSPAARQAAITALGVYGGSQSASALEKLATSLVATVSEAGSDPKQQSLLTETIVTLVGLDAKKAAALAVPQLAKAQKGDEAKPLFAAFVQNRRGPSALAAALTGTNLHQDVAMQGIQSISAAGQVLPELTSALVKAGSLPETALAPTPEQLRGMVAEVKKKGNAQRGREIFRREKLNCMKCHQLQGEGGKVGPDLSTIGTSAPMDYLIESLLVPNAKVKEGFHAEVIVTEEGEILTGIPVSKTEDEYVIRNAEDKLISIPTQSIEQSKMGASIMPTGLTDSLNRQEFLDLVRFLSELGKPNMGTAETVLNRRWGILGPFTVAEGDQAQARILGNKPASNDSWTATSATNAGWMWIRDFALRPERPILFARCQVDVTKGGKIALLLEPAAEATLWIDGVETKPTGSEAGSNLFVADWKEGKHQLLVRIDLSTQPRKLALSGTSADGQSTFAFSGEPEATSSSMAAPAQTTAKAESSKPLPTKKPAMLSGINPPAGGLTLSSGLVAMLVAYVVLLACLGIRSRP